MTTTAGDKLLSERWHIDRCPWPQSEPQICTCRGALGMAVRDIEYAARHEERAALSDDLAHCERAWEDAGKEIERLTARHAALVAAARDVVNAYMGPAEYDLLSERHILALRAALRGEPT